MQQAIYTSITSITGNNISIRAARTNTAETAPATRRTSLIGRVARRWDMAGVLALMGSSAAYGVFALAHVGL